MADVGARCCRRSRAWHRGRWRGHVENQARSGVSAAGYCRDHGLARRSFYRWRRVLRAEEAAAKAAGFGGGRVETLAPSTFAEIEVSSIAGRTDTSGVEVVLRGARRVWVAPGFDEDTLARAVRVLEALPC